MHLPVASLWASMASSLRAGRLNGEHRPGPFRLVQNVLCQLCFEVDTITLQLRIHACNVGDKLTWHILFQY